MIKSRPRNYVIASDIRIKACMEPSRDILARQFFNPYTMLRYHKKMLVTNHCLVLGLRATLKFRCV